MDRAGASDEAQAFHGRPPFRDPDRMSRQARASMNATTRARHQWAATTANCAKARQGAAPSSRIRGRIRAPPGSRAARLCGQAPRANAAEEQSTPAARSAESPGTYGPRPRARGGERERPERRDAARGGSCRARPTARKRGRARQRPGAPRARCGTDPTTKAAARAGAIEESRAPEVTDGADVGANSGEILAVAPMPRAESSRRVGQSASPPRGGPREHRQAPPPGRPSPAPGAKSGLQQEPPGFHQDDANLGAEARKGPGST